MPALMKSVDRVLAYGVEQWAKLFVEPSDAAASAMTEHA